ncbi:olfactory receptor 1G1-like [Discoglossus pictus]
MKVNVTNSTIEEEFHILAFSNAMESQVVLFIVVLIMYLLSTLGNVVIIVLVCLVAHLHTPMYFFLCNLSIQDIVYVSTIVPKLMSITITGNTSISFLGCMTQLFLSASCIVTDFFLLTSMAYDRYAAICMPLHYSLIMNKKLCTFLGSVSWFIGIFNSLLISLSMSNLSFCSFIDINHFYCDMKALLEISCSDTTNMMNILFTEGTLFGFLPFVLIITSYIKIISTIVKIRTSAGRLKTFSSCSSHLTVVIIFYVSIFIVNMKPDSKQSKEQDKLLSLMYVAVVPMLNPLIYSLRNQEVLKALKKVTLKTS